MKTSDIILMDDHVVIEGGLRVDNISSKTTNKPVTMYSEVEIKRELKVDNISSDTVNKPLTLSSPLKVNHDKNGKNYLSINSAGISWMANNKTVLSINSNGAIYHDASVARSLSCSTGGISKFHSQEIRIGNIGNQEGGGANGKIILFNANAKEVLKIEAAGGTAKIDVLGFGDIIDELKKLKDRVALLESKTR